MTAPPSGGMPTVLVVDDDNEVRSIVAEILDSDGFRVLEADGGEEAVRIATTLEGRLDLVLTDIRMPGMDGFALARYLTREWPRMRILFMSGYAGDALARERSEDLQIPLLSKPFSVTDLIDRVRERIEEPHELAH